MERIIEALRECAEFHLGEAKRWNKMVRVWDHKKDCPYEHKLKLIPELRENENKHRTWARVLKELALRIDEIYAGTWRDDDTPEFECGYGTC